MKTIRTIISLIFIFLVSNSWAIETVDRIVAIVDGEIITLFELNNRVKPFLENFRGKKITEQDKLAIYKLKKDILEEMINDILIKKFAKKYDIKVSKLEVENYLNELRKKSGLSKEDFEKELKKEGLTYKDFYQKVEDNILKNRIINAMVKRKVVITDKEIEEYYQKHINEYKEEGKVHLKAIILPSEEESKRIYNKIKEGEITFEQAVKNYSLGPNISNGGDLGKVNPKDLNPVWKNALQNLNIGEISTPFLYNNQWIILKLVDKQKEDTKNLEQIKEKIRENLYKQKFNQIYSSFIKQLREGAVIEVNL